MKSIKQKLMMFGLAASSLFAVPVVNAESLDDTKTEDTASDPFGDSVENAEKSETAGKPAKKENKSFMEKNKTTFMFIGGAAILYGVLKVVEKKKNDKDN